MTTAKNEVFYWVIARKLFCSWRVYLRWGERGGAGGIKIYCGGVYREEIFPGGGE